MAQNDGKVPSNANFDEVLKAALNNFQKTEKIINIIIDGTRFIDNTNYNVLNDRGKKIGAAIKGLKPILDNMKTIFELVTIAGEKFSFKNMMKFELFSNYYEIILNDLVTMMKRVPMDEMVQTNANTSKLLAESIKLLLDSVKIINELSFKSLVKLRIKIPLMDSSFRKIIRWIGLLSEELNDVSEIIDRTEDIGKIFVNIFKIFAIINSFGLLTGMILRLKLKSISKTFDAINEFVAGFDPKGKYAAFTNFDKSFNRQLKLFKTLFVILSIIKQLPKLSNRKKKAILKSLDCLAEILEKLNHRFNNIKTNKIISGRGVRNLLKIHNILTILKVIFVDILLLAIAVPAVIIAVPLAIIAVTMMLFFIRVVAKMASKVSNKVTKSILLSILRVGSIIESLILTMLAVMVIAIITPIFIASLFIGGLGIVAMLLFMILLSKMLQWVSKVAKHIVMSILRITLIMILLCVSMLVIAGSLWLLTFMVGRVLDNVGILLEFLVVLAVFAFAFAGLSLLAGPIMMGMIGVVFIAIAIFAIMLIAGLLVVIPWIAEHIDKKEVLNALDKIFDIAFVVINSLFEPREVHKGGEGPEGAESVIKYEGNNPLTTVIKAMMAMVTLIFVFIAVAMILLIAVMLRGLMEINLDSKAILEKVGVVFDTAFTVINYLYNPNDPTNKEGGESEPWYESLLNWFADISKGIGTIIKAILAVFYLALIMIAIAMVLLIATELRLLMEINLDEKLIHEKVQTVFKTAQQIINWLWGDPDAEKKPEAANTPWYESVFNWVVDHIGAPIKNIIGAILAVGFLAMMIVAIFMVLILAKMLERIQSININEKSLISKTHDIMKCAKAVQNAILDPVKPINDKPNESSGLRKMLEYMGLSGIATALLCYGSVGMMISGVGALDELAKHLKSINDIPDVSGVDTKVKDIMTAGNNLMKLINAQDDIDVDDFEDRVKCLDKVASFIKTFNAVDDTKFQNGTTNMINFLEKINKTDIEKLRTAEKVFKNMAEFSKSINGNFNSLADALNDKIAPLLEELKDMLEQIPRQSEAFMKKLTTAQAELNSGNISDATKTFLSNGDKDQKSILEKTTKDKNKKDEKKYESMQDIMDILLGQAGYKGVKISR